jgi:hypothetical protein
MSLLSQAKNIKGHMDLFSERWDDRRATRDRFWGMIKKVKSDYFKMVVELGNDPGDGSFYTYLQDTYGIKLILTNRGEITDMFEVVDEKKQMMFILKYGS